MSIKKMKVVLFPRLPFCIDGSGTLNEDSNHKSQEELPLVTLSSADEWLEPSDFLMKPFWASGQGNLSLQGTER